MQHITLYIINYTISTKVYAGKEAISDTNISTKVVMGITEL